MVAIFLLFLLFLFYFLFFLVVSFQPAGGVPNEIRTRVTAVKGRCPKPLDDGNNLFPFFFLFFLFASAFAFCFFALAFASAFSLLLLLSSLQPSKRQSV